MTVQASMNIADAKARLSELIDRAAAGEEIILCKSGRPVARLVPLEHRKAREPGVRRDWQIPDDAFLESADEEQVAASP
jgi:prevent-host-death family protein